MKKRLGFIFFLSALAVSGILIFQVYWVYNSYKTEERNVNTLVLAVLQNSINKYSLQQNNLPSTLKSQSPYLSVVSSFVEKSPNPSQHKVDTLERKKTYDIRFQPLKVSPDNLLIVQQMIARLMSQAADKPIRMDLLNSIFKNELKKSNVDLSFKLILLKNQKTLPAGKIVSFINFTKDSSIIAAIPENASYYLLRKNIVPAMVSLVLILLSAGSLYYMGFTIRRQIQLDGIKNDFINNITHELRTPIAILKSSHEALNEFGEVADIEKTKRYLQINTAILNKLDSNVDRILDITKYEQGTQLAKLEPVVLNDLINNIIKRFSLNDKGIIKYTSTIPAGEIVTDAGIIDTIVSNLVDNSFKYADGPVAILIDASSLNNGWQLQVKDNGKGIEARHLPFVFDKFYRVPAGNIHDVKGYGLGLSYVKQLVNMLRGQITIKSQFGKGTTFTIQFPAA